MTERSLLLPEAPASPAPTRCVAVAEHPQVSVRVAEPLPKDVQPKPAAGTGNNEVYRKLLHISPGLLPFALASVPHPVPLPPAAYFTVTVVTASVTLLYLAMRRFVARPAEGDFYITAISYPAAILATLYAFPAAPELACVVTIMLALGDGSAYLGGKLIGGPALSWNRNKTWAGTLCFVGIAGPVGALAYWFEAGPGTAGAAVVVAGAAAVLAAIAESLPTRLSDNLRVGVTAAVTVAACHWLLS